MYGYESWTILRKLSTEELMLLNCGVGKDSWESLGLQGDPTSPSSRQSVLNIHWKYWCWSWNSKALATWCEELTCWKRLWFWERLRVGGEGDDRGWDGWMASLTWWTWVWASSGIWWWTMPGKPGMLQSVESQRVRHDWTTELNWTETSTDDFWDCPEQRGFLGMRFSVLQLGKSWDKSVTLGRRVGWPSTLIFSHSNKVCNLLKITNLKYIINY